jgi:RNA polymerase sigma-70 factor (ECF subfamily)
MASKTEIRTLVRRAKNQDQEAFGELYDEYVDPIFRYIYYKVGDFSESQDLTGQTFLKAFENISSYKMRDVAFSSWLYRIAHNLVVDYFRSASKHESVPIEEHLPVHATEGNPVETVLADMDSDRLFRAMQKLTHNQREIVVLKIIDNLSNEQVAEIMGISVGAVKAAQKRGLLSLNRVLRESSGTDYLER